MPSFFLLLKYTNITIILGKKAGIYMMEKYINEVILDVRRGNEEDLKNTIEEIKAYAKTYENDKVTLIDLKKSHSHVLDEERYIITLQIERDTENLGRKYEYEEEKIVGFFEDEEE
ncbi:hypothetical protein COJ42_07110 [Bacillus cereus]|nr:hypothetical protein CN464_09450 [Bacillus cereus]PFM37304.1 hypothetical protein COJ42_07110 [Bacillus cereus]PFP90331.1 hypothetical protein COK02_16210 [Bacillus cereus]PGN59500.1 hypothetical protein CN966_08020 [Bacillus cereus]PGW34798.1 hypothetical protein COE04_13145 [Bacillus cereus]